MGSIATNMAIEFFIDSQLVSINNKFVSRSFRPTKAFSQCKAMLISEFTNHDEQDRPQRPYKLTIKSYQFADGDNYIKMISDSLEKAGVIENDKYIEKYDVTKFPIKRGGEQHHYIRIEEYTEGKNEREI